MKADKKHILLLSSWYPNRTSPFLGNFVQRQAQLLSKKFQVTVLYTVAEKKLQETDIIIHEKDSLKEILVYHPKGNNFISRRKEQDKAFEKGLELIRDVDLIHAHVILPKGYLFIRAKKKFDCPLIVTEHASYYRLEKRKKWTLKEKFILVKTKKHIDQLVSVSEFLKKDLAMYFDKMEIQVIPNPTDTELFVPITKLPLSTKHFLHISTLDNETKNPKGIVDAVGLLVDKHYHDFEMTIVSDEDYTELNEYVHEKKLESFIHFYGPFTPAELVPVYQNCDAFILFSDYETFSIVLTEAWACGIPTITTPVGIGDALPHELGIQVKLNDPLSLAMAMEKIMNGHTFDPEVIRKHALQFSDEQVLKQLVILYSKFK